MVSKNQKNLISALKHKATKLRIHSVISTSEAGSGHPTSCMSAADIVSVLFFKVMRYDPTDPYNPNNDRFVLSKGHTAPLLYAAWAEAGVIPVDSLINLRKIDSELEGHPTPRFKWADVATGSLGQGLSIALGMALNGKYLDKLDYKVYALLGDGECAEGSVWEAAALAGYYKLDNLVAIVDVNGLGQSQRTMYNFDLESYRQRFSAFGWQAIDIDGHNLNSILSAFEEASEIKDKPTAIVAKTLKGKGVSFLEDKDGWHGKALKKGDELKSGLKELEAELNSDYELNDFKPQLPPRVSLNYTSSFNVALPNYKSGELVATREAYGTALAKLGEVNPLVVALDGDTKNSTFSERFLQAHPDRFFEGFIAEQNMVGAAVGLASRGKIPFASTFAAFLTRAYDLIRMSAISRANVKYAGSHCGVSIGEDGPSQMGLEDLAMMRAIPHSVVLYPSDAVSAERLVVQAAKHNGIVYIRTTRPKTSVIYPNNEEFEIGGCKILRASDSDQVTLIGAGITVHESLKAYEVLKEKGINVRVIDAYSVKPIAEAGIIAAAQKTVGKIVCVEDHYYDGGLGDAVLNAVASTGIKVYKLAVKDVPRSGKPEELLEAYGISANRIVEKVREII